MILNDEHIKNIYNLLQDTISILNDDQYLEERKDGISEATTVADKERIENTILRKHLQCFLDKHHLVLPENQIKLIMHILIFYQQSRIGIIDPQECTLNTPATIDECILCVHKIIARKSDVEELKEYTDNELKKIINHHQEQKRRHSLTEQEVVEVYNILKNAATWIFSHSYQESDAITEQKLTSEEIKKNFENYIKVNSLSISAVHQELVINLLCTYLSKISADPDAYQDKTYHSIIDYILSEANNTSPPGSDIFLLTKEHYRQKEACRTIKDPQEEADQTIVSMEKAVNEILMIENALIDDHISTTYPTEYYIERKKLIQEDKNLCDAITKVCKVESILKNLLDKIQVEKSKFDQAIPIPDRQLHILLWKTMEIYWGRITRENEQQYLVRSLIRKFNETHGDIYTEAQIIHALCNTINNIKAFRSYLTFNTFGLDHTVPEESRRHEAKQIIGILNEIRNIRDIPLKLQDDDNIEQVESHLKTIIRKELKTFNEGLHPQDKDYKTQNSEYYEATPLIKTLIGIKKHYPAKEAVVSKKIALYNDFIAYELLSRIYQEGGTTQSERMFQEMKELIEYGKIELIIDKIIYKYTAQCILLTENNEPYNPKLYKKQIVEQAMRLDNLQAHDSRQYEKYSKLQKQHQLLYQLEGKNSKSIAACKKFAGQCRMQEQFVDENLTSSKDIKKEFDESLNDLNNKLNAENQNLNYNFQEWNSKLKLLNHRYQELHFLYTQEYCLELQRTLQKELENLQREMEILKNEYHNTIPQIIITHLSSEDIRKELEERLNDLKNAYEQINFALRNYHEISSERIAKCKSAIQSVSDKIIEKYQQLYQEKYQQLQEKQTIYHQEVDRISFATNEEKFKKLILKLEESINELKNSRKDENREKFINDIENLIKEIDIQKDVLEESLERIKTITKQYEEDYNNLRETHNFELWKIYPHIKSLTAEDDSITRLPCCEQQENDKEIQDMHDSFKKNLNNYEKHVETYKSLLEEYKDKDIQKEQFASRLSNHKKIREKIADIQKDQREASATLGSKNNEEKIEPTIVTKTSQGVSSNNKTPATTQDNPANRSTLSNHKKIREKIADIQKDQREASATLGSKNNEEKIEPTIVIETYQGVSSNNKTPATTRDNPANRSTLSNHKKIREKIEEINKQREIIEKMKKDQRKPSATPESKHEEIIEPTIVTKTSQGVSSHITTEFKSTASKALLNLQETPCTEQQTMQCLQKAIIEYNQSSNGFTPYDELSPTNQEAVHNLAKQFASNKYSIQYTCQTAEKTYHISIIRNALIEAYTQSAYAKYCTGDLKLQIKNAFEGLIQRINTRIETEVQTMQESSIVNHLIHPPVGEKAVADSLQERIEYVRKHYDKKQRELALWVGREIKLIREQYIEPLKETLGAISSSSEKYEEIKRLFEEVNQYYQKKVNRCNDKCMHLPISLDGFHHSVIEPTIVREYRKSIQSKFKEYATLLSQYQKTIEGLSSEVNTAEDISAVEAYNRLVQLRQILNTYTAEINTCITYAKKSHSNEIFSREETEGQRIKIIALLATLSTIETKIYILKKSCSSISCHTTEQLSTQSSNDNNLNQQAFSNQKLGSLIEKTLDNISQKKTSLLTAKSTLESYFCYSDTDHQECVLHSNTQKLAKDLLRLLFRGVPGQTETLKMRTFDSYTPQVLNTKLKELIITYFHNIFNVNNRDREILAIALAKENLLRVLLQKQKTSELLQNAEKFQELRKILKSIESEEDVFPDPYSILPEDYIREFTTLVICANYDIKSINVVLEKIAERSSYKKSYILMNIISDLDQMLKQSNTDQELTADLRQLAKDGKEDLQYKLPQDIYSSRTMALHSIYLAICEEKTNSKTSITKAMVEEIMLTTLQDESENTALGFDKDDSEKIELEFEEIVQYALAQQRQEKDSFKLIEILTEGLTQEEIDNLNLTHFNYHAFVKDLPKEMQQHMPDVFYELYHSKDCLMIASILELSMQEFSQLLREINPQKFTDDLSLSRIRELMQEMQNIDPFIASNGIYLSTLEKLFPQCEQVEDPENKTSQVKYCVTESQSTNIIYPEKQPAANPEEQPAETLTGPLGHTQALHQHPEILHNNYQS